jgi:hypothetical protein
VTDTPINKNIFRQKTNVSPTPNTIFSGLQILSRGRCVRYSILPRSCTLQRASRLRKTYLFNKVHSPTSVSSNGENSHQIYESSHQNIGFPGFPGIAKLHWTSAGRQVAGTGGRARGRNGMLVYLLIYIYILGVSIVDLLAFDN